VTDGWGVDPRGNESILNHPNYTTIPVRTTRYGAVTLSSPL
jgi:hypothetical protein